MNHMATKTCYTTLNHIATNTCYTTLNYTATKTSYTALYHMATEVSYKTLYHMQTKTYTESHGDKDVFYVHHTTMHQLTVSTSAKPHECV